MLKRPGRPSGIKLETLDSQIIGTFSSDYELNDVKRTNLHEKIIEDIEINDCNKFSVNVKKNEVQTILMKY